MKVIHNLRKKAVSHKQQFLPQALPATLAPLALSNSDMALSHPELYLTVFPTFSQPVSPRGEFNEYEQALMPITMTQRDKEFQGSSQSNSLDKKVRFGSTLRQFISKRKGVQIQGNKSLLTRTLEPAYRLNPQCESEEKALNMKDRNEMQRLYNLSLIKQHQSRIARSAARQRSKVLRPKMTQPTLTQRQKFRLSVPKKQSVDKPAQTKARQPRKMSISAWNTTSQFSMQ